MQRVRIAGVVLSMVLTALLVLLLPRQVATPALAKLPVGIDGVSSDRGAPGIVRGPARVVDGDTIELAGERIRLEGIDAPELGQVCRTADGTWPGGKVAAAALQRLLAGRDIDCTIAGRGAYGRLLGHCRAGTEDINATMIRSGLAWAFRKYSSTYVGDEDKARRARAGIWAADCDTAWDYRAGSWRVAQPEAPNGCAIKGNITRKGRIYHTPWSTWYARTRIDPARGERWFCNEREAMAAGWRPALSR